MAKSVTEGIDEGKKNGLKLFLCPEGIISPLEIPLIIMNTERRHTYSALPLNIVFLFFMRNKLTCTYRFENNSYIFFLYAQDVHTKLGKF